ncbi:MAG: hypothetical protein WC414_01480 [Patescibacteria group bacterium]
MIAEDYIKFNEEKNKDKLNKKSSPAATTFSNTKNNIDVDEEINEKKLDDDLKNIDVKIKDVEFDLSKINEDAKNENYTQTNNSTKNSDFDTEDEQENEDDQEETQNKQQTPKDLSEDLAQDLINNTNPENSEMPVENNPDNSINETPTANAENNNQNNYNPYPLDNSVIKNQTNNNENIDEEGNNNQTKNNEQQNRERNQKSGLTQTVNTFRYRKKIKDLDTKISELQTQEIPFKKQKKILDLKINSAQLKKYFLEAQLIFWLIVLIILGIVWLLLGISIIGWAILPFVTGGIYRVATSLGKILVQIKQINSKIENYKEKTEKINKAIKQLEKLIMNFYRTKQELLNKGLLEKTES